MIDTEDSHYRPKWAKSQAEKSKGLLAKLAEKEPSCRSLLKKEQERVRRMEDALNELRLRFARQELCLYDVEVIASEALRED